MTGVKPAPSGEDVNAEMLAALRLVVTDASYHLFNFRPHVLRAVKAAIAAAERPRTLQAGATTCPTCGAAHMACDPCPACGQTEGG